MDRAVGSNRSRWLAAGVIALLGCTVALLVVARELDPVASREAAGSLFGLRYRLQEHSLVCLALSVATAVLVSGYALLPPASRTRPRVRAAAAGVALLLVASSGLVYLYGLRGIVREHYPHTHDSFHYLLGAKYFGELGYFGLYDCTVRADAETTGYVDPDDRIRDLRSYRFTRVRDAFERSDCRERFGPERWEIFRSDVTAYFTMRWGPRSALALLQDHGYNGTPFHTFVAGRLAHLLPVSFANLGLYALFDVLGLCAMMIVIVRAFGWKVGFLFAIFFFLNFSDRFTFIGGSHFRYAWMIALGVGVACLKRGRPALAGVFMTTAAMLNVFPVLFWAGVGVRALASRIREGGLADRYRRFLVASAVAAAIAAGLGAAHGKGPRNYTEFASFIGGHADKLTISRTGFRYVFLFRGEVEPSDPTTPYAVKRHQLDRLRPVVWTLAGLLLAAGLGVAARLDDVEAASLFGFLSFFVLFGTVEYYYAVAALLVPLWHRRAATRGGGLFVGLLFVWMAVAWIAWTRTWFLEFCNNTVMSVAWTSYLLAAIVYLGFDTGLWRDTAGRLCGRSTTGARRPALELTVVLVALALPPVGVAIGWSLFGGSPAT